MLSPAFNQTRRTRIKMCGITRSEDLSIAVAQGADAIGLVFYDKSPRAVTIAQAKEIVKAAPAFVTTVALFVDADATFVREVIEETRIDLLQFHGQESVDYCEQFQRPYIKAIRMQAEIDLTGLMAEYASAQGLLLDTYKKGVPGGTGEQFNWDWILPLNERSLPLILAGGLRSDNIRQAIEQVQPWAVDVSGGIEASPGHKSQEKIEQFMQQVSLADENRLRAVP